MKLVHWPLMGGLLHLVQRGGDWTGPNVTAHSSTASVPITVLLYNGPLLCGFDVVIKGLTHTLAQKTQGSDCSLLQKMTDVYDFKSDQKEVSKFKQTNKQVRQ